MLSMKLQDIRILFIPALLSISGCLYSQITDTSTAYYDTTDYITTIYKDALDYNLMIAASKGYTLEIDRLIQQGADFTAKTEQGATALIFAISSDQTKVAKMLIDYGSDVNQATS